MKKLDKFILESFIGPFILTFLVVVFILLMQHMLKYFDDIIGKGLDTATIGQLLLYFAIFMIPSGMPLAVLLASLITFGNLGEHFELTAIKASGVSLVRILRPIFFFVLFLTCIAFYTNNYLVPKAALEAYSLLYDIKQKKPALEIREGTFYTGIPDVSIKVDKKFPDGETLKKVIIYDHRKNDGNKEVTVADSGRMSTFMNEQYLKLELFNGYYYAEGASTEKEMTGQTRNVAANNRETLSRTRFDKSQVVFDLSSFNLNRTEKKWFQGDRMMRNMGELQTDIDSVQDMILNQQLNYHLGRGSFFVYFNRNDSIALSPVLVSYRQHRDSIQAAKNQTIDTTSFKRTVVANASADSVPVNRTPLANVKHFKDRSTSQLNEERKRRVVAAQRIKQFEKPDSKPKPSKINIDSLLNIPVTRDHVQSAANYARQTKSQIANSNEYESNYAKSQVVFEVQWHKILSNSLACVVMFLIGAPLGAIIKRGGLGVPFLVSILFFIVFYVLNMQGEKMAKGGVLTAAMGVWMANGILLLIGLFFLRQARIDARLFDTDFYLVVVDKFKTRFLNKKGG
jgi:lipopolysaccharide export system permease protein